MKIKRDYITSIIISLAIHMIILSIAFKIKVPFAAEGYQRQKRTFKIKTLRSKLPKRELGQKEQKVRRELIKFENTVGQESLYDLLAEELARIKRDSVKMPEQTVEPEKLAKSRKEEFFLEDKKDDSLFGAKEMRETRDDLLEDEKLVLSDQDESGLRETFKSLKEEDDFYEKMPGFTPPSKSKGVFDIFSKRRPIVYRKEASPIKRKIKHDDLKVYLQSEVTSYIDPKDGQKYFKIGIKTGKDSLSLPTIPKEIIFLIDSSTSINTKRLKGFKEGIHYALNHLNEGDRFNLRSFKKTITSFREESVEPTKKNIKEAIHFVSELKVGGKTDTYNALYQSIHIKDSGLPIYIFLLSDGWATKGITDPRQLINKISDFNDGRMSIFAFCGGVRVNRYLLDFISYKNRGWTEYSHRAHLIGKNFVKMYNKIKDPILLKVRYRVSGLNPEEMYPRLLPDFFRDMEFTLYGKYTDEAQFLLQLRGDKNEKTNELIVVGDLKDAGKGDHIIALKWAYNKIYHLISQLEYDQDNKEIIHEIKKLSKDFGIKTSYSKNIK